MKYAKFEVIGAYTSQHTRESSHQNTDVLDNRMHFKNICLVTNIHIHTLRLGLVHSMIYRNGYKDCLYTKYVHDTEDNVIILSITKQ